MNTAATKPEPAPKPIGEADPLDWARRLRRREHMCERLTPMQRAAWREALKNEKEPA